MKKHLALLAISAAGLRGEMLFSGILVTPQHSLFSITDTETKASSGWLRLGQTFQDYTLASFDPRTEIITLKKVDRTVALHLQDSKTGDGKDSSDSISAGAPTPPSKEFRSFVATLSIGEVREEEPRSVYLNKQWMRVGEVVGGSPGVVLDQIDLTTMTLRFKDKTDAVVIRKFKP